MRTLFIPLARDITYSVSGMSHQVYIYIHYIIKKEGHDRDILLLYNAVNRDILNVYDHKYTRLAINIHSFPKHARDIWESS